ncbi:MAG: thioredoxin family protein [Allorhizobium sp.]|jgi:thiol:disulfide interchange protein DsbD
MRDVSMKSRRAFLVGSLAVMLVPAGEADAASTVVGPIRSLRDYINALTFARMRNRHALVDVAADWCAFCKTIDGKILVHPRVQSRMAGFALLRIDVTGWTAENIELLRHLNVSGPPTVFIANTESGTEVQGTRSLGAFDVDNLVARLESVR